MPAKPSALVDTRVIYCGDNLEQLRKLPDGCIDLAGRPDIDAFETAMRPAKCDKGFFVSFDYSNDALREIGRFFREEHRIIFPLTVREILEEEIARKVA